MVPFALALCAGVALAGDARRLQIELPPDVTALDPQATLDIEPSSAQSAQA